MRLGCIFALATLAVACDFDFDRLRYAGPVVVASSSSSASGGSGGVGGSGGASSGGTGGAGGAVPQAGDVLWVKDFAKGSQQNARSLAIEPSGRIAITALFAGAIDLDADTQINCGAPDDRSCAVVASFDAQGAHRWNHVFGDYDPPNATPPAREIAFDGNQLLMAVPLSGDFTFIDISSVGGFSDGLVIRFGANGEDEGHPRIVGGTTFGAVNLTGVVASGGNTYVVGDFLSATTFGTCGSLAASSRTGIVLRLDEDLVITTCATLSGPSIGERSIRSASYSNGALWIGGNCNHDMTLSTDPDVEIDCGGNAKMSPWLTAFDLGTLAPVQGLGVLVSLGGGDRQRRRADLDQAPCQPRTSSAVVRCGHPRRRCDRLRDLRRYADCRGRWRAQRSCRDRRDPHVPSEVPRLRLARPERCG